MDRIGLPAPTPTNHASWSIHRCGRAFRGTTAATTRGTPHVRVILRRGHLLLIDPHGEEEALTQLEDGTFRIGEEPSPERVRFDAVVDGKAQRLNLSGQDYYRSPLS